MSVVAKGILHRDILSPQTDINQQQLSGGSNLDDFQQDYRYSTSCECTAVMFNVLMSTMSGTIGANENR